MGQLICAEAEIVGLNAKIDVLKQKSTKKPEGKTKKEENKQQDNTKKEKKKTENRKQIFVGKSPEPIKQHKWLKEKNITGLPITRIK